MNDLLSRLGTSDNLTYLLRKPLTLTLLWVTNYIQLNWKLPIKNSLFFKISLFSYLYFTYLFAVPTTLATQYGHMNEGLVKSNT